MQPAQDGQNPPLQRNNPGDKTCWTMVKKEEVKLTIITDSSQFKTCWVQRRIIVSIQSDVCLLPLCLQLLDSIQMIFNKLVFQLLWVLNGLCCDRVCRVIVPFLRVWILCQSVSGCDECSASHATMWSLCHGHANVFWNESVLPFRWNKEKRVFKCLSKDVILWHKLSHVVNFDQI